MIIHTYFVRALIISNGSIQIRGTAVKSTAIRYLLHSHCMILFYRFISPAEPSVRDVWQGPACNAQ